MSEVVRILIAEPDPALRDPGAEALIAAGFHVEAIADGVEALQLLRQGGFDVVVASVELPGIGGFDLLERLRRFDAELPVLLLSGAASVEGADRAMQLRAFRYLPKPVALPMLVDAVGRAHRQTTANKARWRAPDALAEPDDAKALAALGSRFDDALGRLWMAYQPIIQRSSRTLFAYEAFVRANEPTFDGPADLFRAARLLGRSRRLEQTIRAATHPAVAATQALVFVNLASDGLTDDELFSPASPLAAVAHRVVFELSERALLENIKDIPARIAALRRLGFRIALNDMGSGHSGLNTFAAIDPEIIKLDMTLTRGIESSATKRRVVKSIVSLCENGGTVVVAEGVESQEELDTLSGLGCDYFQGYFFAKAGPAFPEVAW